MTLFTDHDSGFSSAKTGTSSIERALQWVRRVAHNLNENVARYRVLHENRAAFRNLTMLSDRELDDIGLTRGEVEWAAQLPITRNAAEELRKLRQERAH